MYAKVAALLVPTLAALPSVLGATCDWPSASFSLTDADGTLGQIEDGQVRTGFLGQIFDGQVRTGNGTTCLTLVGSSNGTLSDIYGRPCYVTPYFQFECTAALQPDASPYGFCASEGLLTYYGSTTFYACDTGVDDQKNIYVKDISSPACTAVNLTLEAAYCAPSGTCMPTTVYNTATVSLTETVVSVESEVATVTSPTTVYVTSVASSFSTVVAPTTIYVTDVESKLSTVVAATTVYATETVTGSCATVVKSATVTATEFETATVTKGTTVTVTAVGSTVVTPTTVYATKTETETVTVSKPVTVTVTDTAVVTTTVATTKVVPTTVVVGTTEVVPTTVVVPTTATEVVTETPEITPSPTTSSSSSSSSSSTATSSTCVPSTSLYPNLIIPINSKTPDTALGTQFWANLTKSSSEEQDVLLQFDVNIKYTGTCELKFMFPDNPITFPFVLEGDTTVEIYALTSQLTESATWNDYPSVGELVDTVTLTRGQDSYAKGTKCAAGSYQGYLLKCTGNCVIEYFIDYNPPPVGTVLLPCE
ncbi:ubiquitin 3 binding protein But2 C-terminal domain-containing protein [Lipomyces orientalis]|uniref:Ubiquitin 3 binding protein But2 C-terminal domain-containing protein n=1 Tax=Lipomyces orientalis TaxID=1233043 RepID=A0ACC3TWB0_9ASCO